jgi:hypothetical protein
VSERSDDPVESPGDAEDVVLVVVADAYTGEEFGRYWWDKDKGDLVGGEWVRVYQDWARHLALKRIIRSANEHNLLWWILGSANFNKPVAVNIKGIAAAWGAQESLVWRSLYGLVKANAIVQVKGRIVRLNTRFAIKGRVRGKKD